MATRIMALADVHYSVSIAAEKRSAARLLPKGFYDHERNGRLFWHNEVLVEDMGWMLDAVARAAADKRVDTVVFVGDLVNVNSRENVAAFLDGLRAFPCPVEFVLGNHDVYLEGGACAFTGPDRLAPRPGVRHCLLSDKTGLILIDVFVKYSVNTFKPNFTGRKNFAGVDYRPEDIRRVRSLIRAHPDRSFIVFGHLPLTVPRTRSRGVARKLAGVTDNARILGETLAELPNVTGVVTGHNHCAQLSELAGAFHWSLPALAEYPCAAGIVEIDGGKITAELFRPLAALSRRSLAACRQRWPDGTPRARKFLRPRGSRRR